MYITIEGPIGVGKSSLTRLISEEFNFMSLFEIVEENPFLERFYLEQDKYAFQTEMFFLTNRYTQQRYVKDNFLNKNLSVVSDYNIKKNLIFANNSLAGEDLIVFKKIFENISESIAQSDLTIFLTASLDTLKFRIAKRGRAFEEHIADAYLEMLIGAYNEYIIYEKQKNPDKIIVLDANKIDFVNNKEDRNKVIDLIKFTMSQMEGQNE